jgi:hypothetical protein
MLCRRDGGSGAGRTALLEQPEREALEEVKAQLADSNKGHERIAQDLARLLKRK